MTDRISPTNPSATDSRFVTNVFVDSSPPCGATILVNGAVMTPESDDKLEVPSIAQRRKVSLMPMVTEEDLRLSGLAHRDPISVAQVFGEDFASRFCVPVCSTPTSPSPPPYDSKEKMLIKDVKTRLPFGKRDERIPRGVPALKVRVKKSQQLNSSLSFEDVSVALPPSFQQSMSEGDTRFVRHTTSSLASENYDFQQFQIVFNDWIKGETGCRGSAFIINSSEYDCSVCHVCDSEVLEEPISCGDSEKFTEALGFATSAAESVHDQDQTPSTSKVIGPVMIDIREFNEEISEPLWKIVNIIASHSSARETGAPAASVCGVMTGCGFVTALLLVHQSESKRNDELKALLHHFGMIASLTSVAWNVEEQRRIAHQSEIVLSTTQSVFASIQYLGFICGSHGSLGPFPCKSCSGDECDEPRTKNRRKELTTGEFPRMERHTLLFCAMIAPSREHYTNEVRRILDERKLSGFQPSFGVDENGDVVATIEKDMNLLVNNITKEAKMLVSAEICSLFLLDSEHDELVAEVFEQKGNSDEYLQEIRMPLNQGIVGHVATTGQLMNVKDVYNHPYFYPNVDQKTGFKTRNILCFPIKDSSGNLVGVAELCNKIDKPAFTLHDEQVAMTFAVYCAISISHCLLYRKLQEAHRRSHMAAEVLVQGSTLSIAPEDILRLTVREIPSPESFHPNFSDLCFVPRSIGTGDTYVEASLSMFQELGFIEKYRLRRRTLARFILMVQKGYRDVPYHNWSHAFAVAHFCYLLCRIQKVKDALGDLERLSLLVACLCHDIDHRGTTNAFQLQSKTPLAQLYSSEGSVLERHHFAQTVTILGMDECNIFETLTRQQYQTVLDNIREVILATDIAAHLRKVQRIRDMVDIGYDFSSGEHHYLFMCLLMTASDLSDQSKDFRNSKAIAENIYKEFFSQGDLEKQMGNRPLEMMDRERACVPKIQLDFMDTVALPVFEYLGKLLPETMITYESFKHNRSCWAELDHILQEEGVPQEGLNYLKDDDLEKKVLDRVSAQESCSPSSENAD
ncbi:unnamed protein product [Bursaphelenchus xylophilus]|uniref:Phosphodiesterase n=1 Tax=Bursaphelenchus xylophilus TaxID=6326 RepID=A0A7I8WJF5_BURXY|nr:unnamed protein product [Bursaphelenchus xylophilus]CAG9107991.1 unnamed protein product [Bursaphelenchus xylophilus]